MNNALHSNDGNTFESSRDSSRLASLYEGNTLNISCKNIDCIIRNLNIIKRYTIIKILKSNSRKIIYEVFDEVQNRKIVLKFILKNSIDSYVLKNYEFIRKNPHPNLNKVIEIGEISIFYVITLEYIEGLDMNEYFKKDLDKNKTHKIFFDLIFAIEYLHNNNILHGDIKPDNIVVRSIDDTPILIDFDLMKVINDDSMGIIKSKPFGTKEFMAPELYYNNIFSLKSDIWSLGINFYICISNQIPSYPTKSQKKYQLFKNSYTYFSNKYGRFIINIIKSMCIIDPFYRPSINILVQSITKSKYFKKIYIDNLS